MKLFRHFQILTLALFLAVSTLAQQPVKKEFGHEVSQNMVYMVKTKANMDLDGRVKKPKATRYGTPMTSTVLWVDAIKTAKHLLKATGSVANAMALLKAVDG